jgi:hypothetical protein
MAQPKTEELFLALLMNSYYSLPLVRSWIAATSIIRPWLALKFSEKLYLDSVKSGNSTVKLSVKSKLILNLWIEL